MQTATQKTEWLSKANIAEKLGIFHVPRHNEEGFLEQFPVKPEDFAKTKGKTMAVPTSELGDSEVWLREMKVVGAQSFGNGSWQVLCEQGMNLTVVEYDPGKRPDQANIWRILRA